MINVLMKPGRFTVLRGSARLLTAAALLAALCLLASEPAALADLAGAAAGYLFR